MRTGFGLLLLALGAALLSAQEGPSGPIIRAEKKLVLVDVVVTDKKGDYVHDLTVKDFRVWEDKDEQTIETFSSEADPASPASKQNHYLVLFFDNTSMSAAEQIQARQAALKFVDKNTSPNRLIAVVNFGGSLKVAQNFTSDAERLKQVINGVKFASVSSNGDALGGQALSKAEGDFGARTVLLGLRSLAKGMMNVPGRKTLIFLSSGFKLDSELRSELSAVVDVCNKANVAVYPIDVRGLVIGSPGATQGYVKPAPLDGAMLVNAAYQVRAGGGGSSGGTSSGGGKSGTSAPTAGGGGTKGGTTTTTGSRPGTYTNPLNNPNNPLNPRHQLTPGLPDVTSQQDVLYALARGTGGFVIVNTNDLLGGLDRIANEQNEYYVLGYSPKGDAPDGACHELRVKVDRGGANVRSRTGYCNAKPMDLLAGSAKGRELEGRAAGSAAATVAAKMQTAFFYTGTNTARVTVAMEVPAEALEFQKEKGKMHSELSVLGIASNPDGSVAAKFSDALKLDFQNKKEVEAFTESPLHYETQFDIASGSYTLKVVFTAGGESFGKMETPLKVDTYDNTSFGLSGVAMSREMHKLNDLDAGLDAALLADKTPLVVQGTELTPAPSNLFHQSGAGAFYIEIYEPLMTEDKKHQVGIRMVIVDRKTGQQKIDSGLFSVDNFAKAGNPVIPVGLRVPLKELGAGSYRAEFKAVDDVGHNSVVRTTEFEVQP